MESFLPLGGFQLPFQKRLSRLYNDTKKSSDFVKEPIQNEEDPQIKALHRKLRIQKDRLVSWGVEWSDPNQSEIDESLSKAGLSEVVGSIMSTIKDTLAEAEPLWLSSKRMIQAPQTGSKDTKPPLIQWDKNHFEDLVNDLTTSIDTLYDLSRTRAAGIPRRLSKTPFKSAAADDYRPFESTRMQTPQQIDPQTLTHWRPKQGDENSSPRDVVYMSKTIYSELTNGTTREPWGPLLLEYATFDSIYASTGIMPPMARFEKLSAGLQQDSQRSPGTWTGLPRLLGYFEDMENSRLGLVYLFPPSFNTVLLERLTKNLSYSLPTLGDLLSTPGSEPKLEAKFRLAHNLMNTIFDLHARGITHGNILPTTVSFCDAATSQPGAANGEVDIRRPLLSSFDLFSEDAPSTSPILSKHPLDPRNAQYSPLANNPDQRVLDLYSLATLLLSVGLWKKLEEIVPENSTSIPGPALEALAIRCGSLYAKAVQACWTAVDDELAGRSTSESLLSSVQVKCSRFLEACCILDGVSGLEERLDKELNPGEATNLTAEVPTPKVNKETKDEKGSKSSWKPASEKPMSASAPALGAENTASKVETAVDNEDALDKQSETKMRLYPHVPLAPEVVDRWNKILMPQINHALRHFYRKNPESVEISLESVGPSPQKTQPTVLVVCTSVGKVRAILKKRIGDLFDGTTGFGLKVCRGHVLRSRRQPNSVLRSMARRSGKGFGEADDVDAINPEYQERPSNGASIGAWIGDRHLPPVSLGGLVIVDDKPYGMTVHHMLDDPDRDFGPSDTLRCSALPDMDWYAQSGDDSTVDDDFGYELSDTESEAYSDSDITSDYDDDEEEEDEHEEYNEPGDIPGIEPGCGDGYIVTQPALDDVEEGFYPDPETQDEDHIDTYSVGEVYASSGIRRKQASGLVHEVDWALFEFAHDRLPDDNTIPRVDTKNSTSLRPTTIVPSESLPNMEVQCMARTSGLQTGKILPALTSVKIYGRASPSHAYQVTSGEEAEQGSPCKGVPLGIPGDSGAWIVSRDDGQLCGHVLAWSQRKRVAYICPMDVLLQDIADTLEAHEVKLPGGSAVIASAISKKQADLVGEDLEDLLEEEEQDLPPQLVSSPDPVRATAERRKSPQSNYSAGSERSSSSPIRLDTSSDLGGLPNRFEEALSMSGSFGIGVSG
ncbi:protein kinase protein [Fusarium sporotrichioides]|uniref:Protein kinase protein n=1 Tax=Fusarium sporotrichioides TaxID=5514 RepID=A0A395SHC7_FUSSP|nr:protein kinase protein [Fusarium sporotrichioides]